MIEERGRVVAIEPGAVWVSTSRKTTCSGCSANSGCGEGLGMTRPQLGVRALCDMHLEIGDPVVIGMREDWVVRASVLVYILPLLSLLAMSLTVQMLGGSEPLTILAGLLGLVLGWLVVCWFGQRAIGDPGSQPVVLRAIVSTS